MSDAPENLTFETPDGRKFRLAVPDAGDQFDVLEMAGARSTNQMWMLRAMVVYSFAEKDGIPLPRPATVEQLKANARDVGEQAINMAYGLLFPEVLAGAEDAKLETAKN